MKISVIIPVHNSEDSIRRCIESIMNQNYHNLEIILVENGSTDNTLEVCKLLCSMHEEIILLRSEPGVSRARNLGLEYATGEIISFCDADDMQIYGDVNTLWEINRIFGEDKNINAVCCSYTNSLDNIKQNSDKFEIWNKQVLMKHIVDDLSVLGTVWNKFFKSEVIGNVRFDINLSYCEDMHWLFSVLSKQSQIKCYRLFKELYYYEKNNSSATNSPDKMYNSVGQLKYVEAFERILEIKNISFYSRVKIKWNICEYSMLALSKNYYNNKNILINNIKKYWPCFFIFMWSDIKKSIKALSVFLRI